ncbi:hypothetical protein [Frigidibacter sp. SD6-1]|uniref:hypothetical protein n=1 Tax=Frigidibacter sp. SD6-1 TaxID=3032581 RepID=UPI0024E02428|nr:hypothetical protein [Frigidibacter sp. SD6-1]
MKEAVFKSLGPALKAAAFVALPAFTAVAADTAPETTTDTARMTATAPELSATLALLGEESLSKQSSYDTSTWRLVYADTPGLSYVITVTVDASGNPALVGTRASDGYLREQDIFDEHKLNCDLRFGPGPQLAVIWEEFSDRDCSKTLAEPVFSTVRLIFEVTPSDLERLTKLDRAADLCHTGSPDNIIESRGSTFLERVEAGRYCVVGGKGFFADEVSRLISYISALTLGEISSF